MTCPLCDQDQPIDHAIEWDCEPAPGSDKWGMSVCATCYRGVYGEITPWDWVETVIHRERKLAEAQRNLLGALIELIERDPNLVP